MAFASLRGLLLSCALCWLGAESTPQVITDVKTRQDMPNITTDGRQIKVNGTVLHMKGVCWNPVPRGAMHPDGADYSLTEGDAELMRQAGINAVRLYIPITNTSILDIFQNKGIWVIQPAYNWAGQDVDVLVPQHVNPVKDHPNILMWEVGNEWNYNMMYWGPAEGTPERPALNYTQARDVALEALRKVKELDDTRPVATVFGELPSAEDVAYLDEFDVWGLNLYRFDDFEDLFVDWRALSGKPMYIGEYGCDAYNANISQTDLEAQAYCTKKLTQQIVTHSVKGNPLRGTTSGGLIFELADEWWKAPGDIDSHDVGGVAPGGGPYPDRTFNEEWWGLVDVDRSEVRPAYNEYKNVLIPESPAVSDNGPRNTVVVVVAVLGVVALGIVMTSSSSADGQAGTEMA